MKGLLRRAFRAGYYALYGNSGKVIQINNEDYTVSAHVARGINKVVDDTPIRLLLALSKNADVVFDVGANIGVIAIILAKKMKPGSAVYSFEPAPTSFKYLADMARVQKGNAKITALNYAVSSAKGHLHFTNDGDSCTNHIVDNPGSNTISVEAVTLDDYCKNSKIIPQVIKVDVEGAEYWALQGMEQTLKNNDVKVLMEIHQGFLADHNITGKMFAEIIDRAGYKTFNTEGQQIDSERIVKTTCVVLAKEHPGMEIFKK